ncbi:TolC family outer membrane protein [Sheuella amnicola]|nr:TolC family outer membrane protein [Sheuella amnicola]
MNREKITISRIATVVLTVTLVLSSKMSAAIDLKQCWQLALTHDPVYAAARANYRAMMEKMPQARSSLLPRVSASAAVGYLDSRANTAFTQVYQNSNTAWALTLSQPIFNWSAWQSYEQSKLVVASAEIQLQISYQDLVLRVGQAYFEVLAAQDALMALQAEQRAIAEQLASAKRRFDMGKATITDTHESQSRYDLASANIIAAQNTVQNTKDVLSRIIGRPVDDLSVLPYSVTLPSPVPNELKKWSEQSQTANLEIIRSHFQTRIAEADVDIAKGGHYPTVSAFASTSSNTLGNMYVQPYYNGRTVDNVVGVMVNVPLYSGGMTSSRVSEKSALHEKSVFDLEAAKRLALQQSQQYFNGVTAGLARIKGLEASEKSSNASLQANRTGYEVGVRINLDVLNAQQQLYTTMRELALARYNTVIMGLRLRANSGILSEDDLITINALLRASGTPGTSLIDTERTLAK